MSLLAPLPCHIFHNKSAEQGCQLRECVRCCSLIDVTVRVSLLEEPRPYCSSLTHWPFTHMTYSVSHTHIHSTVQRLQCPSLLSPSVVFFSSSPPLLSVLLPHAYFHLYSFHPFLFFVHVVPQLQLGFRPTVVIPLSLLYILS